MSCNVSLSVTILNPSRLACTHQRADGETGAGVRPLTRHAVCPPTTSQSTVSAPLACPRAMMRFSTVRQILLMRMTTSRIISKARMPRNCQRIWKRSTCTVTTTSKRQRSRRRMPRKRRVSGRNDRSLANLRPFHGSCHQNLWNCGVHLAQLLSPLSSAKRLLLQRKVPPVGLVHQDKRTSTSPSRRVQARNTWA